MSLLTTVLRAAHCRSTHHYFAIDSAEQVVTDAGRRLSRVLLRHHERYLAGATDPDERFRDFQNHYVHVGDDYWGGAPRLAVTWYERLKGYLVQQRYADAAYAAGVFSHYFTDPLQPLHTGHSDREAAVHRALEWSVFCSYQAMFRRWQRDELRAVFVLGDSDTWLAEAIYRGARFANHSYDRLVQSYDLQRGSVQPDQGLDDQTQGTLASLIGLAVTGLARVWERLAQEVESESGTSIDSQPLFGTALMATLQIAEKKLVGHFHAKRERRAIGLIYDEFQRTGNVVEQLPSECNVKRQVWAVRQRESQWPQVIGLTEQIAGLSLRDAQLLVAAGYDTVERIRRATVRQLQHDINRCAQADQSQLWAAGGQLPPGGPLPDEATVSRWQRAAAGRQRQAADGQRQAAGTPLDGAVVPWGAVQPGNRPIDSAMGRRAA